MSLTSSQMTAISLDKLEETTVREVKECCGKGLQNTLYHC